VADDDFPPTPEQQDIIDAFQSGDTVAAVALAGTGKTTTQRLCAEATRRRGLYLAFNKAIATEAEYLFPARVKASTIHSLAYRNVDLPREGRQLTRLNQRDYLPPWDVAKKVLGIKDDLVVGDKKLKPTKLASLCREMVAKFCYSGDDQVELEHVPFVRGLDAVHDDDETLDAHGYLAEFLLPYARDYWAEVSKPVEEGRIRFEHDHYLKIWALSRPVLDADFICVDEAQDLNGVVIRLVNEQDAQLLICGDSNQQIYQWRGSVDAMDVLEAKHRLPLTQSWRFGPEVAEVANAFLARLGGEYQLRGNPAKTSGVVEELSSGEAGAVLTRTNAGMLDLLLAHQRSGRKVAMQGRKQELSEFCEAAEKMQRGQIVTHRDLQMFSSWSEVQDYANEGNDPAFALLVKLVTKYGALTLINALDDVVRPERADVQLSTAHSAKGLEWDRVQIGNDWEAKDTKGQVLPPGPGELRLRYVAVTRAKDALGLGSLARELDMEDNESED
jgi:superfamily I DNA/RNA helicase